MRPFSQKNLKIMHFSTFKAPKPHILFQRALARDLQVPNMREGFWKFTQRVTVAGFGKTENRRYSESDTAKVNFFAHAYVTLTTHRSGANAFLLQGQANGNETLGLISTLQRVEIPLVSNCSEIFRRITIKPEHQICAGQRDADSCMGDSGGPLVAR